MSDDWRKDNPKASIGKSEKPIALDSLGIPILDEVIAGDDDFPLDEELLAALSKQLRTQLKQDMANIIGSMANVVVANINTELKRQVRMQLSKIIEQHLDRMINRAITDIAKSRNGN